MTEAQDWLQKNAHQKQYVRKSKDILIIQTLHKSASGISVWKRSGFRGKDLLKDLLNLRDNFNIRAMGKSGNIIYKVVFAAVLATSIPVGAHAQEYENTPVEISKEKVKIDGNICYSHIVLEKQTLYSISKAYGVSINDIYRFNPGIKENGLKKNSILIIPSASAISANSEMDVKITKEEQVSKEITPRVTPDTLIQESIQPVSEQTKTQIKIQVKKETGERNK